MALFSLNFVGEHAPAQSRTFVLEAHEWRTCTARLCGKPVFYIGSKFKVLLDTGLGSIRETYIPTMARNDRNGIHVKVG